MPNPDPFIQPPGTSRFLATIVKAPLPPGARLVGEIVTIEKRGWVVRLRSGTYVILLAGGGRKPIDQRHAAERDALFQRTGVQPSQSGAQTAIELKGCREVCGLNQADWAIALGYRNKDRDGLRQQVNDMEARRKGVTPAVARLAEMYRRFGVPDDMRTETYQPQLASED